MSQANPQLNQLNKLSMTENNNLFTADRRLSRDSGIMEIIQDDISDADRKKFFD